MSTHISLCLSIVALVASGFGCSNDSDDWEAVTPPSSDRALVDVWAFDEDEAWFVDFRADVHVFDGSTWSTRSTPANGVSCIFALEGNTPTANQVWLCAGDQVLVYDGSSFAQLADLSVTGLEDVSDIWASSPSDIWVVGQDAIAAHYDGTTWTRHPIPSSRNTSVWGSGPQDVYAMGSSALMHYDGTEWLELEIDDGRSINGGEGQVWGTSSTDVWVVTDSYEHFHFNGQQWRKVETEEFIGDLATIWGSSPNQLWGAGNAGSIGRYDGSDWEEIDHQTIGAPYLRQFFAMHGSAANNIWIIGHQLGEGGVTPLIRRYRP